MKIALVVQDIEREADGVAVFVRNICATLTAMGHSCDVITPINQVVDYSHYDVVHINALWSPWLHQQAARARRIRCGIVWSPHGMLTPWALRQRRIKKMIALVAYQYNDLRLADMIHVTAPSEEEDVRRLRLKNPIVIAPLGAPIGFGDDFAPGRRQSSQKRLLFLSRVQRKKGIPMLLEAWSRLPGDVRSSWEVQIAGPDQEGHTAELLSLADKLGIAEEVHFLGAVYGQAKEQLFRDADLFVLPTHSENFGAVVVEALAKSCPVICTQGAPWKDLEAYRCGWWCEPSVKGVLSALQDALAKSSEALAEMGDNGLRLVKEKYTWRATCDAIVKGYEQVLSGRRPRGV